MLAAVGPDRHPLNFPLAPNKLPWHIPSRQLMETQLLLMELMWPRSRRGAAGALIQTPPM